MGTDCATKGMQERNGPRNKALRNQRAREEYLIILTSVLALEATAACSRFAPRSGLHSADRISKQSCCAPLKLGLCAARIELLLIKASVTLDYNVGLA